MKRAYLLPLAVCLALGFALHAAADDDAAIDIPYSRFVLDNGLTLIVHEDHKAPIVAVNVWYHVGSKNEKPGKTGFAHLFEHLMFNGSEHHPDDFIKPFNRAGATGMNGTTSNDRTNYFENVPTTALDMALWMESDRMGHLLGAIDQDKLDEQRGVVQNEIRQGENQPYGKAFRILMENTYPAGHPYSWSIGGSLEDLDAASLEDVHEWFKKYYGAANAVLAIAGDVDAETVREKVERYFGDVDSGPPVEQPKSWVARRTGSHRRVLQDRVPQARIYKAWNVAARNDADTQYLELASGVLTGDKTSRLYKRLVYDEQIATDVSSFVFEREMGSLFIVTVTAQPGGDLDAVERALDEELARLVAGGPTDDELARAKTGQRAAFVRGVERIGGFGGTSDVLARNEVFAGDPGFHKVIQRRMAAATAADVQGAARRWLADGEFVLEVRPFPDYKTAESAVDRSQGVPAVDTWPEVDFPELQRARLSNGLEVILAERHTVPVVHFNLVLDAGYAADQFGVPGTASLAMDMLDEGTASRDALAISQEIAALGARLSTDAGIDTATVYLSALKENLDASLAVFADIVLHPSFPAAELERLRKQQLASIQREKTSPFQMALRVFPRLVFGDGHAYALPLTGSGTEESVASLERDHLVDFHHTWFKPDHATLVVVGDATLAEVEGRLETLFADWRPGEIPEKNLAPVEPRASSTVYLIDRPDSVQSVIIAGHLMPPKANPHELALESMNRAFGGGFSSRLNMNLREDKSWSYGAGSFVLDTRAQRPFIIYAPVQSDKTKEALAEIRKELADIVGPRPPDADEVGRVKDEQTLTLPGRWETARAVLGSIVEMVEYDLPEDYWDTFAEKVRGLGVVDVAAVAKEVIHPGEVVWVVVGDRRQIEEGIRELGLGEIRLIDADGNPL